MASTRRGSRWTARCSPTSPCTTSRPLARSPRRRRQRSKKPPDREARVSDVGSLSRQALAEVAGSADLAALDDVRVRWLGKKGVLTEQLKSLRDVPAADRPAAGQRINEAKDQLQAALDARRTALE